MIIDWEITARILEAIAWPFVALITLISLRNPLHAFLERVAKHATRVTVGDYSIELPELREASTQWQTSNLDVRKMTSAEVFDSATQSLFTQLTQPDAADYVLIDLGDGDQWLSSRLLIFAVVLGRVRGVKALCFVATRDGFSRRYLGAADPEATHLALARRYPWLEAALAAASQPYDPKVGDDVFACLAQAPMDNWQVQNFVRTYVEQLQQNFMPVELKDWESSGEPPDQKWERTSWLKAGDMEDMLGEQLMTGHVISTAERSKQDTVSAVLRCRGHYVALVDEDRRLVDLVDRSELLRRFIAEVV